jgi:hypothetical protein
MWWLSFIPDEFLHWFIHGVLLIGLILSVVGAVGKNIPFIGQYGLIVKGLGGLLFILGVFFEGGYGVEMSYRARIEEMQAKINEAVAKSDEANSRLASQVKQEVQVIHDTQVVVQERIVKDSEKIDAECKVDPDVIDILNQAARSGGKK